MEPTVIDVSTGFRRGEKSFALFPCFASFPCIDSLDMKPDVRWRAGELVFAPTTKNQIFCHSDRSDVGAEWRNLETDLPKTQERVFLQS